MTPFERLEQYTKGNIVEGIDFKKDIEVVIQDYKLQEQYVKHLEQEKENMKKIINILCDTISQKKGHWIYPTDVKGFCRCEHCGTLWGRDLYENRFFKYCPRCGADMRGDETAWMPLPEPYKEA